MTLTLHTLTPARTTFITVRLITVIALSFPVSLVSLFTLALFTALTSLRTLQTVLNYAVWNDDFTTASIYLPLIAFITGHTLIPLVITLSTVINRARGGFAGSIDHSPVAFFTFIRLTFETRFSTLQAVCNLTCYFDDFFA